MKLVEKQKSQTHNMRVEFYLFPSIRVTMFLHLRENSVNDANKVFDTVSAATPMDRLEGVLHKMYSNSIIDWFKLGLEHEVLSICKPLP